IGIFRTDDGGANWSLVAGMPSVSVFDLAINPNLGILRAATHGRGVYELKLSTPVDTQPPTIVVSTPNGGESLIANGQFNITWTANDNVGVTAQEIALSTDGGASFPVTIASGLAGNAQSFQWTV